MFNIIKKEQLQPIQKWEIDKTFSFCYGHRVWVQKINTNLTETGHTCPRCRHIHGHEGLVQVFLEGDALNDQGMVEDFVHLGWVKNFLDDHIDHKFILDVHDPWFLNMLNLEDNQRPCNLLEADYDGLDTSLNTRTGKMLKATPVYVPATDHLAGYEFDVKYFSGAEKEFYEGYFIVDFVPTSENLSKWLFDVVDSRMSQYDIAVSKISWNETPKSRAVYSRK